MSSKSRIGTDIEINADMKIYLDIRLKDSAGETGNILALNSIVEEVSDGETILIHMPIHQGYHYPLPHDEDILMKFFIDADIYALNVQFEERLEQDGFVFAKMRRTGKIAMHQQRECFRFPCSMDLKIDRPWYDDDKNTGKSKSKDSAEGDSEEQLYNGRIIDFSDGGMRFDTNENLLKGEMVTLTFDIGQTEVINGVVLRSERVVDGKYLFKAAVKFKTADKTQKDRFYKYIVGKQQEERRRKMF